MLEFVKVMYKTMLVPFFWTRWLTLDVSLCRLWGKFCWLQKTLVFTIGLILCLFSSACAEWTLSKTLITELELELGVSTGWSSSLHLYITVTQWAGMVVLAILVYPLKEHRCPHSRTMPCPLLQISWVSWWVVNLMHEDPQQYSVCCFSVISTDK